MKMITGKMKITVLSLITVSMVISSCSDLEIEETDSVIETETGEFNGVASVDGVVAELGNRLTGQIPNQADLYALNEVSSDELLVPTRGTDWSDNGQWRVLHQHDWDPLNAFVLNVWNNQNSSVFLATTALDPLSNPTDEEAAKLKFYRAYNMFWIMDLFGQVPFREATSSINENPTVFTRSEALEFVLRDLREAIPDLPSSGPNLEITSGPTQAGARLLLAKILLNAHIYNGSGTPDSSDLTEVVNLVDEIKAQGYDLQEGYFNIFTPEPDSETIFYVNGCVCNRIWNGLHYSQNAPDQEAGGWNGWSTLAEFYNLFEGPADTNAPNSGQEERRGFVPEDGSNLGIGYGFLVGQQFDENGQKLKTRTGQDLVFTKDYPGILGNDESTGIRTIKYHPENGSFTGHQLHFRYADAHLMKAEALFRNGDTGGALTLVNELRTIRQASALTSLSERDILDERGRELYKEFWRRNDQIRFGTFSEPWGLKENTEEFRTLYPIPETAVLSNPNLLQNPGY